MNIAKIVLKLVVPVLNNNIGITVSAQIKAPLKNNSGPRGGPSLERKKILRGLRGALFGEAHGKGKNYEKAREVE